MLNRDEIEKLVQVLEGTHENEIDCEECLQRVDRFVEMKLAGLDAEEAMPLVEEHLEKCGDCREEFEALLAAMREVEGALSENSGGGGILDAVRRIWRNRRNDN